MVKLFISLFLSILSFNVYSQSVTFTYSSAGGGSTLCSPAVVNFTPVSTGNLIGYTWYFGNGQTSNSAIPSMTYASGTYVVKLVAVFDNVALETVQTLVVNPGITVDLSGTTNYICKLDTVGFTALTTTPNVNYLYNFNDGSQPITSTNNNITHNYTSFGLFYTSVKATNVFGCTGTDSVLVEVKKPPIVGNVTPVNGCAPINANFNSQVTIPGGSTVTNYAWSFGDGTAIINTNTPVVSHPYTDSGNFVPTLTITTSQGCTNTFTFSDLNYGLQPQIVNAYPKQLTYCGNEAAEFVGIANFATSYKWEFGDGSIQFTNDTTITHKYNLLGIQTVRVTPINNECEGTPYTITVNIIGVIASYKYANTCVAKNTFSFINTSQGNQSFKEWIFGDGSPNVYTTNAIRTYPPYGVFNTMLIIGDDITGCRDSIEYPIYTATPTLVNPDTFVCRKAPTTFRVINNYPNPSLAYKWSVLGLPNSTDPSPYTIRATAFGNFNQNYVIIYNGNEYCPDTIRLNQNIRVGGPQLNYSTDTSFCTNNNFVITNTSTPHLASDTIKSWRWTFGIPGLVDTAYQPAVFVYSAEGYYPITLIAKDKKACIDTLIKNIYVKESPFLRIFPRTAQLCFGQTITLTGYHTDTMVWSPASLVNCATCDTTFATPLNSTKIYAIASNANCSLKDSSIITVYKPFIATATPNMLYACLNEKVNVTIRPANKKILWSPNFGLSSTSNYNPVITVLKDTNYLVTLTDSLGCYSSDATVKIRAYPQPIVNAGPDRVLSYNSPFTISPVYSGDVTNYLWTPSNNLSCSNCPKPNGNADTSRTFVISASNSNNCTAKDTIKIMIECAYANLYMASAFSPDNIQVKKYYYPQTRGIKMINRFAVFNRYGEVIYEIKNAAPNVRYNGWDGKFKGVEQITGGYVYMLDATCEKGETLSKKGSFLLIR